MRLIKGNVRGSTRVVHGKMQIVHSYDRKDAPKRFTLKIEDKGFREKEFRTIEEAVSEIEKYELPGVLISVTYGEKTIRLPFEEWKNIHADEFGLFGSRPDFDELLGKYKDREIKHRSGLNGGGKPMVQLSLFRAMSRPRMVKATVRGHMRHSKSGKIVTVQQYDNTRVKKPDVTVGAWPEGFPNVIVQTTVSKMKRHPDYKAAKGGNREAAQRLVYDLLTGKKQREKIHDLAKAYPEAIVVAPHAIEASGKNKIPETYAAYIEERTGLKFEQSIVQSNIIGRTGSGAWYRMAFRPKFDGEVETGKTYILVDDVVTQGGTLSELRYYIEKHGGKVVCMTTLGQSQFSANIALTSKTKLALEEKFGIIKLGSFLKENGLYEGNHEALTESEARTLLHSKGLDAARDRIAAERQARDRDGSSGILRKAIQRRSLPIVFGSKTGKILLKTVTAPPEMQAPGKIRNRPGLHFDRMKHRWLKNDQQTASPRERTANQEPVKTSRTKAEAKAVKPQAQKEEVKPLTAWMQEHGGKIPKNTDVKIGLGGGKVIPAGASEIQLPRAKADKEKWNVKWRHPVTGKWEYHYKQEFLEGNAKRKFAKMADMARTVVKIRHRIETDLNPENPTDIRSVLAIQTWMLDHLYARIGSEENTKEHGVKGAVTYGLTTLTKDHVMFTSKGVQIKYIGKKSQIQKHTITDPQVVEAMKELYHATPTDRLFQYKDEDGWHPASADKLNDHLKANFGLTGKDFRTFHATHLCWTHLRSSKLPKSERERTKALNTIIKSKVAPLLGHTFGACKNNYIDPGLQEAYLRGKIPEKLWGVLEKSFTRILKGFLS